MVFSAVVTPPPPVHHQLLHGVDTSMAYQRHVNSLGKYYRRCVSKIVWTKVDNWHFNISVLAQSHTTSIEPMIIMHQLLWGRRVVRMSASRLRLSEWLRSTGMQRKRVKNMLKFSLKTCNIKSNFREDEAADRSHGRKRIVHLGSE